MIDLDYPLDYSLYSVEEITFLIKFLNAIEATKRKKPNKASLIEDYKRYRSIIANKSEEKRIDKAFEKESGVSVYKVMQKVEQ